MISLAKFVVVGDVMIGGKACKISKASDCGLKPIAFSASTVNSYVTPRVKDYAVYAFNVTPVATTAYVPP